ncbi:hypothetical protein HPP92_012861 [Vanilla planifolia]|uniref:Uncharacterized protein n=1 Tax=Vanilla planifolia TaxID=51239 RepID=A0A835UXF9_VANPL|nr:hypothetical protein HPP92_012861 [Vanilla planifolia]
MTALVMGTVVDMVWSGNKTSNLKQKRRKGKAWTEEEHRNTKKGKTPISNTLRIDASSEEVQKAMTRVVQTKVPSKSLKHKREVEEVVKVTMEL